MALTSQQQLAGAADGLFEPSVGHFWSLLKPRVMSLVVFTGFAGMYVAPGSLHPLLFAIALFAIAAGAGASGAINQWYDRDIDAVMSRTKSRPIPAGFMAPAEALTLGLVVSALSVLLLGLAANWLAASLLFCCWGWRRTGWQPVCSPLPSFSMRWSIRSGSSGGHRKILSLVAPPAHSRQ